MPEDFDPQTMVWVLDGGTLNSLLGQIEEATEVVVDLETTGLDEHAYRGGPTNAGIPARVVLASLTLPHPEDSDPAKPSTWVVPLSHPDSPWLGKWREVLRDIAGSLEWNEKPLINANMKFDARWFYAMTGVDLSRLIVWDTQVSSHLLDENASTKLKVRAPATFGVRPWDEFDLSVPGAAERCPLIDLGVYGAQDTYWAWRLAAYHRALMYLTPEARDEPPVDAEDVTHARLGKLATWCAMPMVSTLTAVEQRGMVLDQDWVNAELEEKHRAVAGLSAELAQRYVDRGLDPDGASFAPTSNWFREWSSHAVEAGDLKVTAMTDGGRPQWSKSVLLRQARSGSQVAQDLLDLRGAAKKAEYLASWLHFVTPESRIHTNYHPGRVITGRLSSSEPNMQQVTASLKPAFVPTEGFVLADLDYSQIELRVAAFISRCEPMIEAFQNGWDLHRMLAAKITGKPQEEITPNERQAGKSANFGLLYMMGAHGFREYAETTYGISFTLEEATDIHRAFYEMWEGIGAWHARAISRARATGQVISPIGRVRRVPDIWDGNEYYAGRAERAAVNSPVQGFASDLMQMAAASIEGMLPGSMPVPGVRLIGTVHDSILVEVPEESWEISTKQCIERMLRLDHVLARLDCRLDVPLAVEAKVSTRWGLSDVGSLH